MRRLVSFSDGTWKSSESEKKTNVYYASKSVPSLASDGVEQLSFYDPGVGTGSFIDKMSGGAFGRGLDANIRDVYRFIASEFEAGDQLHLFGFSRGAYTARSAVGLMRKCGILRRQHLDRLDEAFAIYRRRDSSADVPAAITFREKYSWPSLQVRFLGVWDTVGSLGIPLLGLRLLTRRKYQFHDTELSGTVSRACHAVAIDERRGSFKPTLWDAKQKEGQIVEQVWFPGVHSDVGGGYEVRGLADVALAWMLTQASQANLEIDSSFLVEQLGFDWPYGPSFDQERYGSKLHNSLKGLYFLLRRHTRSIGHEAAEVESVWHTGLMRLVDESLDYGPKNLIEYMARPGRVIADHG